MKTFLLGVALFFAATITPDAVASLVPQAEDQIQITYASGDQLELSTKAGTNRPTPPAKGEWFIDGTSYGDVATIFAVSIQDTSNPADAIEATGVWKVVVTPPNGGDPVIAYFREKEKPEVPTKGWWKPGRVYTQIEIQKGNGEKYILLDRKWVSVNMANAFSIQIDWLN